MLIKNDQPTILDLNDIWEIETLSFSKEEIVAKEVLQAKLELNQDSFLVARNQENKVIAYLGAVATSTLYLKDEYFFTTKPNVQSDPYYCIIGLAVHPDYRKDKVGSKLLKSFVKKAQTEKKQAISLTCAPNLVKYYEKFGFKDHGIAESKFAKHVWHNMVLELSL